MLALGYAESRTRDGSFLEFHSDYDLSIAS
jgi:hypothetical protein